jgi:hypothetical protein
VPSYGTVGFWVTYTRCFLLFAPFPVACCSSHTANAKTFQGDGEKSFFEAEKYCQEHGGNLVSIHHSRQNDKLFESCSAERCWIGLTDDLRESQYQWTDGRPTAYMDGGGGNNGGSGGRGGGGNNGGNNGGSGRGGDHERISWPWAAGEPSNTEYSDGKDEDCMYMYGKTYTGTESKKKHWGDKRCDDKMAFLCETDFEYVPDPKTYAQAEAFCQENYGGFVHMSSDLPAHLTSIHSDTENSMVLDLCEGERCWLGFSDVFEEGLWKWLDLTGIHYTNWEPGEPNNQRYDSGEDEDCGYIHGKEYRDESKRGKWGDRRCSEELPFVCRRTKPSHGVNECSFSAMGVDFNLGKLAMANKNQAMFTNGNLNLFEVDDTRLRPGSHRNYSYVFSICGNVPRMPQPHIFDPPGKGHGDQTVDMCTVTSGDESSPKWNLDGLSPAYQLYNSPTDSGAACYRLGDTAEDPNNVEWGLIDSADPAKGVKLTYKNGNLCNDKPDDERQCRTTWNNKPYCHRQMELLFQCADDTENVFDTEKVVESSDCNYQLFLKTAYGCPLDCPVTPMIDGDGLHVCGGHGTCVYNRGKQKAECVCEEHYDGEGCKERNFRWQPGQWSQCDVSCGIGKQQRSVHCVDPLGVEVEDSKCDSLRALKPERLTECFVEKCPEARGMMRVDQPMAYGDAMQFCMRQGGSLAVIKDKKHNDAAFGECFSERCWIGYTDIVTEGTWDWVDKTTGTSYVNWAPGEPSNSQDDDGHDEDCGYMYGQLYGQQSEQDVAKQRKWGDKPCHTELPFLCHLPTGHGIGNDDQCTFSAGGVTFDLAPMRLDNSPGYYTVEDSSREFTYLFNICGDTNDVPDVHLNAGATGDSLCHHTVGSDSEPHREIRGASPAYQLTKHDSAKGTADSCHRLASSAHNELNVQWQLWDPEDPTAGVMLSYLNGDVCRAVSDGKSFGCSVHYNDEQYCSRRLNIALLCADDATNVPDYGERIYEMSHCEYTIFLPSVYGCPTGCPLSEGPDGGQHVCGMHGTCAYDWDAAKAHCFCNEGYYGPSCDEHKDSIKNRRYELRSSAKNFNDAERSCQTDGGHLASAHSSAENSDLYAACGDKERCWIGFSDARVEGHWTWTDSKDSDVAFTNWAEDEPSDTHDGSGEDEDCAYIYGKKYSNAKKRSKWGDKKCSESFAFICVFPPAPKPEEPSSGGGSTPALPDPEDVVKYFWYADPIWGQCTGSCNNAYRRRTVKCTGKDGGETKDVTKCMGTKPDEKRECTPYGCIPQPTPAPPPTAAVNMNMWSVGSWGRCEGGCPGLGTKHRTVRCQDKNGKDVSNTACPILSREEPQPISNQPCMVEGCDVIGANNGGYNGDSWGSSKDGGSSLVVPFVLVCLALASVVGWIVYKKGMFSSEGRRGEGGGEKAAFYVHRAAFYVHMK